MLHPPIDDLVNLEISLSNELVQFFALGWLAEEEILEIISLLSKAVTMRPMIEGAKS